MLVEGVRSKVRHLDHRTIIGEVIGLRSYGLRLLTQRGGRCCLFALAVKLKGALLVQRLMVVEVSVSRLNDQDDLPLGFTAMSAGTVLQRWSADDLEGEQFRWLEDVAGLSRRERRDVTLGKAPFAQLPPLVVRDRLY